MIEDLSYSGLTDLIQRDLGKRKDVIIELSERYISQQEQIDKSEKLLKDLKQDRDALYGGVQKVMRHLTIKYPLSVRIEKGIFVISEKSITMETNVI